MAFVKFLRGSVAAYNRLAVKDNDTLYFIYENADDETGSLYLGSKLISGPDGIGATILSQLADVNIEPTLLRDGMILQYNGSTNAGVWNVISLRDALSNAGIASDGSISVSSGERQDNESIETALERIVPEPTLGDIIFLDGAAYLYDGTEWKPLSAESTLEDRVDTLETLVGHPENTVQDTPATGLFSIVGNLQDSLNDYYTKNEVDSAIAQANHLTYKPVSDINLIDVNDAANQNTMFLVPTTEGSADNQYEEYLLVENHLERIGKFDLNLNEYVRNDDSRLLTQEQKDKLDNLIIDETGHTSISDGYIKSVDSEAFSVSPAGKLTLTAIPPTVLNLNAYALKSTVGDLDQLVHHSSSIVNELNVLSDILMWHPIETE